MKARKVYKGMYEIDTELGVVGISKSEMGEIVGGMNANWFIEVPEGHRCIDEVYETLKSARDAVTRWVEDKKEQVA